MRIIFLIILFFCISDTDAQQSAQFSMASLDVYQSNLAYVGIESSVYANGFYRKQWLGIDNSPQEFYLDAIIPIDYIHGGIGLSVSNDNIGLFNRYMAKVSYNYILDLNAVSKISIGTGLGFLQHKINGSLIRTPEGNYKNGIDHQDIILSSSNLSTNNFGLSIAAFYQMNDLGVGLSMNDISLTNLIFKNDGLALILNSLSYYNMFVNYSLDLSDQLKMTPSVLFKTDLIESQLLFSIFFEYNYNIFAGMAFRGYNQSTSDAFIFSGGTRISDNFKIGYAYDMNLSSLKSVSSGSHEIYVSYNLNKKLGGGKLPGVIYNPRY